MENTITNIEIEIYEKDNKQYVFMSHDGSSGVKLEFKSNEELRKIVANYIEYAYLDNK